VPLETVIQLATANVQARLAAEPVDELVYAVALMAPDDEDAPFVIAIGRERDRAANRVAANVGMAHPLRSVTDDFVVYAWPDSLGDELSANLRFSAGADAAQLLRARNLLPDDPRSLEGFPVPWLDLSDLDQ
jgi:hypothetical protein